MSELPIKVTLTILEGENQGQSFELDRPYTVFGRAKADIILRDRKVSANHLAIHIEGREVFAEDLGSTNGTYCNDQRLAAKQPLRNMDELSLGHTRLRIHIFENLEYFRKLNRQGQETSDTRRRNLDELIDEELGKFSRWDLGHGAEQERPAAQVPKQKMTLEVVEGPEKGRRILITRASTSLGRGKADVRLKDPDVSRNHLVLECYGAKGFYLLDQASTNGTYLNNKRITQAKLQDGDIIQLGSTALRVRLEG